MKYTLPIEKIARDDEGQAGYWGVRLGEMSRVGVSLAPGFVVGANAFFDFLRLTGLDIKIRGLLEKAGSGGADEASRLVRAAVARTKMPNDIEVEVADACRKINSDKRKVVRLWSTSVHSGKGKGKAVGLSGVNSELLNVWAEEAALAVKSGKNLSRQNFGVAVQLNVNPEASGIAFSIDPITSDKSKLLIEAVYGMNEILRMGAVTPDHFEFDKGSMVILYSQVGLQDRQMVVVDGKMREIAVSRAYMAKAKISEQVAKEVAKNTKLLESYLAEPVEVKWFWDGKKVYIVGVKPEETLRAKVATPEIRLPRVLKGAPGAPGIGAGRVVVARSVKDLDKVQRGDILVTKLSGPELRDGMRRAAAVVVDHGGRTSQVSLLGREMGVPAVVGSLVATTRLQPGQLYTVNGTNGEVYSGMLPLRQKELPYEVKPKPAVSISSVKTATKLFIDLDGGANEDADGGVVWGSRLISEIGIHPRKTIKEKTDKDLVMRLTESLSKAGEALGDRPVLYVASDLNSKELRELDGGEDFEAFEENPALGVRGARRHLRDADVFVLELEALKKARNVGGFRNLSLVLPLVRTPEELSSLKQLVTAAGLHRSASFKLYLMVQTPANVLRLADFAKAGIDGLVVDGEHLARLVLGNDVVEGEVDASVAWCLEKAAVEGRKAGMNVGFSGGLSEGLLGRVVGWGYGFVVVSPANLSDSREKIAEEEKKLVSKK